MLFRSSREPDPYDLRDVPPQNDANASPAPPEVLPYARPKSLDFVRITARLGWQGDGRIGCAVYVFAVFCLTGVYCSTGRALPHPLISLAMVSLAIVGIGLYGGIKNGAWGFLIGASAGIVLVVSLLGLIWSVCGY